jgi:hypothetical protein
MRHSPGNLCLNLIRGPIGMATPNAAGGDIAHKAICRQREVNADRRRLAPPDADHYRVQNLNPLRINRRHGVFRPPGIQHLHYE